MENKEFFDYGLAQQKIKKGEHVARKNWNGKGLHIELCPAHYAGVLYVKDMMVIRKEGSNDVQSWVPSSSDALAEDWYVIDNQTTPIFR